MGASNTKGRMILAGFAALASMNGFGVSALDRKARRTTFHCTKCHAPIPPGRPDRQCKACFKAARAAGGGGE